MTPDSCCSVATYTRKSRDAARMNERERQVERCGRRAAELLTAGDCVLTDNAGDQVLARLLAALDAETRAEVRFVERSALAGLAPTLCLLNVECAALDGSFLCGAEAFACAAIAQQLDIPCYVLLPDGPDPLIKTIDGLK